MNLTMVQRAVGQGGLFHGSLDCGEKPLRWVYDCGSIQLTALNREIAQVAADSSLDILFLSHLDSDHVSGVDRLLATTSVTEVVLPYLTAADLSFAICRDVEAGRLTGVFLDFAVDPAGWLIGRGAAIVTFFSGHNDDDPTDDGPDGPAETGGDGEGPVSHKWSRQPVVLKHVGKAIVQRAASTAVIRAQASGRALDWILAPYAFSPSAGSVTAFVKRLRAQFGPKRTIRDIVSQARTASGREKLRLCYDALWKNHNLVSMSLYAGSERTEPSYCDVSHKKWRGLFVETVGWLSTGDADLESIGRRSALLEYYKRFRSRITLLVVPHHGAATYFHNDLVRSLPSLRVGIAAAGKNSYGHPHRAVKDAFRTPRKFCKVSSAEASRFLLSARF
jgi:hypothetical protein